MIAERLKSFLGFGEAEIARSRPGALPRRQDVPDTVVRHSSGLDQFLAYIRDETGLTLLDLGGANQENITYITTLGHKLYSEDPIRSLRQGRDQVPDDPMHPADIEMFLEQNLNYPDDHFDGVLVWDVLEYLEPRLLSAVMERLHRIVKPASCILGVFRAQEKAFPGPFFSFRIHDSRTMILSRRGLMKPIQVFNNRNLEKLFHNYGTIKFFLSRDGLRDVLVRR